jgi:ribose transport system substrate-binding protein
MFLVFFVFSELWATSNKSEVKRVAYLVDNIDIPFWKIMANGINSKAKERGYVVDIYNSQNSAKQEIIHLSNILKKGYAGLIVSPTNSSNAVTILRLAQTKNLPVVISDIGSESDNYVSYISSNNYKGAYEIGKVLVDEFKNQSVNNSVAIIAIPQTRENGKQRTKGFLNALENSTVHSVGIKQLNTWTDKETYEFTKELIEKNPELKAIWIQTSSIYKGALKAIEELGKQDDIALLAFDAEPEFIELIKNRKLIGSGMQQPHLMGEMAMETMNNHLNGKAVEKNIQLDILIVSYKNIDDTLKQIKKGVFGLTHEQ